MALPETAICQEHDRKAYLKEWGKYSHKLGDDPATGKGIYCNKTPEEMGINPNHKFETETREPHYDDAPAMDTASTPGVPRAAAEALSRAELSNRLQTEARGKTRCQVACAVIQHGGLEAFITASHDELEQAVNYVMGGPSTE